MGKPTRALHAQILVPLDGSALSEQALVQLGHLLRTQGARVRLLTVVDDRPPFRFTLRPLRGARDDVTIDRRMERAHELLTEIQERLRGEGVEATIGVRQGSPAEAILREIAELEPSLVAMTTHGRSGLAEWAYGSVAQRVLRHCAAPLLLLKPRPEGSKELMLRRLVVALDGSERAARVLPLVQDLATRYGAEIILLSAGWVETTDAAIVPPSEQQEIQRELEEALEAPLERLRAAGLAAQAMVEWAPPAQAIRTVIAREHVDLIALTTHGRTGFDRFLLGSVAEKTLRSSPVPVLLLRTPGD